MAFSNGDAKKEIAEIKRQFTPANCSISRICGCYVDGEKEKKTEIKEAFLSLPEEEMFKYEVILNGIYNKTKIEGEYKKFVYENRNLEKKEFINDLGKIEVNLNLNSFKELNKINVIEMKKYNGSWYLNISYKTNDVHNFSLLEDKDGNLNKSLH